MDVVSLNDDIYGLTFSLYTAGLTRSDFTVLDGNVLGIFDANTWSVGIGYFYAADNQVSFAVDDEWFRYRK